MKQVVSCLQIPQVHFRNFEAPTTFLNRHRPSLNSSANAVRLLMASHLPKEIRKVLWLDSDIIVQDDIRKLWTLFNPTTSPYTIAAVPREDSLLMGKFFNSPETSPRFYDLFFERYHRPFPADRLGFNAGVLLLNLDHIRHDDSYLEREVLWWMQENHNTPLWEGGSQPLMYLMALASPSGWYQGLPRRWHKIGLGMQRYNSSAKTAARMVSRTTSTNKQNRKIGLKHYSGPYKPWKGGKLRPEYAADVNGRTEVLREVWATIAPCTEHLKDTEDRVVRKERKKKKKKKQGTKNNKKIEERTRLLAEILGKKIRDF